MVVGSIEWIEGKLDHIHLPNSMVYKAEDIQLLQGTGVMLPLPSSPITEDEIEIEIFEEDIVYISGKGNCRIFIDINGVQAEIIYNVDRITDAVFLLSESLAENAVEKIVGHYLCQY